MIELAAAGSNDPESSSTFPIAPQDCQQTTQAIAGHRVDTMRYNCSKHDAAIGRPPVRRKPEPAPATATFRLRVTAGICPHGLLRVVGLVAQQGMVPDSVHFRRRPRSVALDRAGRDGHKLSPATRDVVARAPYPVADPQRPRGGLAT